METFITSRSLWAAPVFYMAVACAACTQESPGGADAAAPATSDAAENTPVDASVEGAADAEPAGKPDAATPADAAVGGDTDAAVDWDNMPIDLAERPPDVCPVIEEAGGYGACTDGAGDANNECVVSADCQEKPGGVCYHSGWSDAPCECRYNSCLSDADCPTGQLCACFRRDGVGGGNTCVEGCRSSAECKTGEKCVVAGITACGGGIEVSPPYCKNHPDLPECGDLGVPGYRCTDRSEDECWRHDMCPENHSCVFSAKAGFFRCLEGLPTMCE